MGSTSDDRRVPLTIVMPLRAYHPPFLEHALNSLRVQTFRRWRLLIVDDSAAPTRILDEALADPRASLVPNRGCGLAAALNTGMRAADTDFVTVLFADDMWSRDAAEILARHIQRYPNVDLFHSGRVFIDEDGKRISGVYRPRKIFDLDDFPGGSPVKHLLCWRREKALALGGIDESLRLGPDDYDFPWRMAESGAAFMAIDEPLYLVRDHRECERLTTHLPLSVHKRDLRRILEKHGVERARIEREIVKAEQSYLTQCIYRNRLDRWLKAVLRHDPRDAPRLEYR